MAQHVIALQQGPWHYCAVQYMWVTPPGLSVLKARARKQSAA